MCISLSILLCFAAAANITYVRQRHDHEYWTFIVFTLAKTMYCLFRLTSSYLENQSAIYTMNNGLHSSHSLHSHMLHGRPAFLQTSLPSLSIHFSAHLGMHNNHTLPSLSIHFSARLGMHNYHNPYCCVWQNTTTTSGKIISLK